MKLNNVELSTRETNLLLSLIPEGSMGSGGTLYPTVTQYGRLRDISKLMEKLFPTEAVKV